MSSTVGALLPLQRPLQGPPRCAPAAPPPPVPVSLNDAHIPYPDASTVLLHPANHLVLNGEYVPRLPGLEKVWKQGYTGNGQTVAVIDSGLYLHADIKDKVVAWQDMTAPKSPSPYDPDGHGTHVAGIVAGNGGRSAGKYQGVAPDAKLVGLRIETVGQAIEALHWVIDNKDKYHISVVNMSLGDCVTTSYKDDPWDKATQDAMDAGLVVVVAAGNECCGPSDPDRCDLSISSPGNSPGVITVGAYDDKGTPTWDDDSIASFSAHGPTPLDNLPKPDIVAPGVSVVSTVAPASRLDEPQRHIGKDYIAISGTSQATPMVAGLAALLLQANPNLTHPQIKDILQRSASHHLPAEATEQGAGLVLADKALELALATA